ncbi:MAG: hypothetical protein HFE65_05500 [Clostridiales bacterium]|nr:hypothetical protein [Clostridiales bacterium]
MKYQTARRLTTLDISVMSLTQVQRHKIRLLDAWREKPCPVRFFSGSPGRFLQSRDRSRRTGFCSAGYMADGQIKLLSERRCQAGSLSFEQSGIKVFEKSPQV